jgi:uncharacterized NAD(P)/FAD-binding protein YdhS
MSAADERPVIAIVGGGFSSAALAIHLAKRHSASRTPRIVVFEPRETLGAGLAYSTKDPAHRINVPAGRMSVYPDHPESFLQFAHDNDIVSADPEALGSDGLPYLRRSAFGAYVGAEIEPYIRKGVIEHIRSHVTFVETSKDRWRVETSDGRTVVADALAIAVSHPAPALPKALSGVAGHPKLIADVTQDDALRAIEKEDRVLIVGNGLTSADVVAGLNAKGHTGDMVSISRRGIRSRGHAPIDQEPFGDFTSPPSVRASDLLRRIREALRQAAEKGLTWHAVLDAVRAQGQTIWRALPVRERRRVARWARPYWDAHRFRIAPPVEAVLDAAIASGRLSIRAASLREVKASVTGFEVTLVEKHQREVVTMHFDAIAVTTGPAHGGILASQPFLARMANSGLLTNCETGLGIACDLNSVALDRNGAAVPGLFIAGPLARGTFGELMGLPQVTEHAVFVAEQLSRYLIRDRHAEAPGISRRDAIAV